MEGGIVSLRLQVTNCQQKTPDSGKSFLASLATRCLHLGSLFQGCPPRPLSASPPSNSGLQSSLWLDIMKPLNGDGQCGQSQAFCLVLQGACGTCASSSSTMKLGIERSLRVSHQLFWHSEPLEDLPCFSAYTGESVLHLQINSIPEFTSAGCLWRRFEGGEASGCKRHRHDSTFCQFSLGHVTPRNKELWRIDRGIALPLPFTTCIN